MLEDIESLLGGLVGRAGPLIRTRSPILEVHYADLGDLERVLPQSNGRKRIQRETVPIGIGVGRDSDAARTGALAEALERYAASMWRDEQFVVTTADDLGDDALDLDTLPRCSAKEQENPYCSWVQAEKNAPLRWVRGISLMTMKPTWIPAVMVYLGLEPAPGERFAFSNSTGCACHETLAQALVTAICEVIERDAVALVWLQQLRLRRIEFTDVTPALEPFVRACPEAALDRYFFDATSDFGVPTVYGVELAAHAPKVSTLIACATNSDPERAVQKVTSDLASHRLAITLERPIPDDPKLFTKSFQGCLYMAHPDRRHAFEFLLGAGGRRAFHDLGANGGDDDAGRLAELLGRLRARNAEAFAVDLSTDEVIAAGMWVVRVVIPQLQPLTFNPNVRYLAHPRLYDAPMRMGHRALPEERINPWPQPFG
jgi:ribosomal protein S12 methylthiotransferase accessory factor